MANPHFNEYWGAHRAVVNWITEFTTTVRDNITYLAEEQRAPKAPSTTEPPGTPYMEHTTDFDDSSLPIPASAAEANL